jgi:hypothetical protein
MFRRVRRRPLRTVLPLWPLVAAGAFLSLASATASATRRHTHLVRSEPAANDSLAASPSDIKLGFSERVELRVTRVKLTDAAGRAAALGKPARPDDAEGAAVVVPLSKPLARGSYTVSWSTAAKDGHPARGTIGFVVLGQR